MNAAALARAEDLPLDVRVMQLSTRAVLWLLLAVVVAAGAVWVLRQPLFEIRGIRIEGEHLRNGEDTLRAVAAPRLRGNFLTLDLRQARAAFEAVPWVRRAVVRRVWPNQLVVRLEEHQPAALWATAGGAERLVNTHGEVFDASSGEGVNMALATLSGPEGSAAQVLAMLQRLQAVLEPLGAGEIELLALSARGSWQVTLTDGAVIALGRGTDDEVIERAQRFVQTMPRVDATYRRPLVSADLRHRDGFAVRLRGLGTLPPGQPPLRKP